MDNIGTGALTIDGFIDLLPEGYSYLSTSPSGDITDGPSLLEFVSAVDRQRVTWQFSPPVSVAAGTAKTLIFSTTTAIDRGNYWNDLLVDFGGGTFDEDVYTWPTALVSVKDAYDVTASNGAGVALVDLKVQTGDLIGVIESWYIR